MHWKPLSLDQYATLEIACGAKLTRVGSNWWRRVAPFFYRPLDPFTEIAPGRAGYPPGAIVGGIQHAVPWRGYANSFMNFFVYEDLQNYHLGLLEERRRRETRRSLEHFTARPILDAGEFATEAYPIYREFYQRTKYQYRSKQRLERAGFRGWANALFAIPGVLVLGAYRKGQLQAVDISLRLGAIIFDDTFFSNTESLRYHVTNFTVHSLRELAAATDALWLCRGGVSNKQSLDLSKQRRGCSLVSLPARYEANPFALAFLQIFRKDQYRRILGLERPPGIHPGKPRRGTPHPIFAENAL